MMFKKGWDWKQRFQNNRGWKLREAPVLECELPLTPLFLLVLSIFLSTNHPAQPKAASFQRKRFLLRWLAAASVAAKTNGRHWNVLI